MSKQLSLDIKQNEIETLAQEIILAIERFNARINYSKYSSLCPLCMGKNSIYCSDCDGSGEVLDEAAIADDRLSCVVNRIKELMEGERE